MQSVRPPEDSEKNVALKQRLQREVRTPSCARHHAHAHTIMRTIAAQVRTHGRSTVVRIINRTSLRLSLFKKTPLAGKWCVPQY